MSTTVYLVKERLSDCAIHYRQTTLRCDTVTLSLACPYFDSLFETVKTKCSSLECTAPRCVELPDNLIDGTIEVTMVVDFFSKIYRVTHNRYMDAVIDLMLPGELLYYGEQLVKVVNTKHDTIVLEQLDEGVIKEVPIENADLMRFGQCAEKHWRLTLCNGRKVHCDGENCMVTSILSRRTSSNKLAYDVQVDHPGCTGTYSHNQIKPPVYPIVPGHIIQQLFSLCAYFGYTFIPHCFEHAKIQELHQRQAYTVIWDIVVSADKFGFQSVLHEALKYVVKQENFNTIILKMIPLLSKNIITCLYKQTLTDKEV